jgi:NADH-quinone oxidoreductase subunit N
MTGLVVLGVIASAIAAFFYVRVIVLMFFSEPAADGPSIAVPTTGTVAVIALSLLVTVGVGVFPQPMLDLANQAASGLFIR